MPYKSTVKVYGDRTYTHTTMVRHQGVTVAFAMDQDRRIYYSILNLGPAGAEKGELDVSYWHEDPVPLHFPTEIAEVGHAIAGATRMPVVKRGGRVEADADDLLEPEEIDEFLSTTARLSAAAPFQVVSDGTYLVLFRQAIDAGHDDAVFKLADGGASGGAGGTGYVMSDGQKIALVDDTLLCDRFLLVGAELKPVMEVRYQRSRHSTRPASAKDTLGTEDMEGNPFYEPTHELTFIRGLAGGGFAAVLLPTAVHGVRRWQLFATNNGTGRIDSFNIEQSNNGLFNTQGTQYYTSPDPEYAKAVFERAPGTCPFTGKDLVPVVSTSGFAETALRFNGDQAHVKVERVAAFASAGGVATVEAWVKPSAFGGLVLATYNESSTTGAFTLGLDETGLLVVTRADSSNAVNSTRPVALGAYTHVAAVIDQDFVTLYLDGEQAGGDTLPGTRPDTPLSIGARYADGQPSDFFAGDIDEIRVWNRVRSGREMAVEHGHRLVGNEPGLLAYYRFDEGAGTVLHDQTDNALHGALDGVPTWVTSEAPVGDHPGMRRDSFVFAGRSVASGLAATLYFQQEKSRTGYGGEHKPLKKQARVLLAAATAGPAPHDGGADDQAFVAVLDVAVGRDGRLAQIADQVELPAVSRPGSAQDPDQISALQQAINALENRIAADETFLAEPKPSAQTIAEWEAQRSTAEDEVARLQAQYGKEEGVLTSWIYRIKNSHEGFFMKAASLTPIGDYYHGLFSTKDADSNTLWHLENTGERRASDGKPYYRIRNHWALARYPLCVADVKDGAYPTTSRAPTGAPDAVCPAIYYKFPPGDYWLHFMLDFVGNSTTDCAILARANDRKVAFTKLSGQDYENFGGTYRTVHPSEQIAPGATNFRLERVRLASGVDESLKMAMVRRDDIVAKLDLAYSREALSKEAQDRLMVDRESLQAKRDELAGLTGGRLGGSDVTIPMPHLYTDRTGLSVAGGLLAFAWTRDTPFLLDSTVGHVALYFRGGDGQFFAAYYDTEVSRSSKQLDVGTHPIRFVSRDPMVSLGGTTIEIRRTNYAERCRVIIKSDTYTETFSYVPTRVDQFADVINGSPLGDPMLVGEVTSVTGLNVRATVQRDLKPGTFVTLRGVSFIVSQHAKGATLSLHSRGFAEVTIGEPVYSILHDPDFSMASRPGVSLATGSQIVLVDVGRATGDVLDLLGDDEQSLLAGDVEEGHGCRWRGETPGRAFHFDGEQNRLALPAELARQAGTSGNLTVEAWINPDPVTARSRVLHAITDTSDYALGLTPAPLLSALAFDGVDDQVDCGPVELTGTSFTIEFWAKRQRVTGNNEFIIGHGAAGAIANQALNIGFRATNVFTMAFWANDLDTKASYTDLEWHHWAAVFDQATNEQILYRDGTEVGRRTVPAPYGGVGKLLLGGSDALPAPANVRLDEVRVWGRARTAAEMHLDRDRRLTGREAGLLGYWSFTGKDTTDRSGNGHHGTIVSDPVVVESPINGYRIHAALGDRRVHSMTAFPSREWAHVAAAMEQSWAVRLDGRAHLDAGSDDALDICGELTVEAFVTLDTLGHTHGLVSYGAVADGVDGNVPYQFSVRPDGTLEFCFEDTGGNLRSYASVAPLRPNTFHRVAVIRKAGNATNQKKGIKKVPSVDADGNPVTTEIEVVESVTFEQWHDISFFIDGRPAGEYRYDGTEPDGGNGPLELGRIRRNTSAFGLRGVLAEVRLWRVARDPGKIGRPVGPRDDGLVGHWRMEENAGNVAGDVTGLYPARLRGAKWTRNPDPEGNPIRIYHNGAPMPTERVTETDIEAICMDLGYPGNESLATSIAPYIGTQVTLGGLALTHPAGSSVVLAYGGVLDEVRIWRTARIHEQILDNLFTRLKGEKDDLIACYSFDAESTETAAVEVRDTGLRGNHLLLGEDGQRPEVVLSTAPVSTDTAGVRSALSSVRTRFHDRIDNVPGVAEYADAQVDARGGLGGVMKRCYGYQRDGTWYLITGYKVGNLISEWVSQAQFAPQIIGYIEGAPPVPSENLTEQAGGDFTGASTVKFRQADKITDSLSSSREDSINTAFKMALEASMKGEIAIVTAPFGIGVSKPMVKIKATGGLALNLDFSNGWTNSIDVREGHSTTRSMAVRLTGHWEDPGNILNSELGRRYVPANTGFAVVQSETADIFALRLAHNNMLVAYRMMPSPNVPRDWNIIPFPLNPRYTKQGTLDGAVGFTEQGKVLDRDYPQARDRGEYSYFKPTEAYALKRRFQRERQQLQGFYASLSTETRDPDPTSGRAAQVLSRMIGTSVPSVDDGDTGDSGDTGADETNEAFARRNLANTYVWTADGGFFAETTETTDVVTETVGGKYSTSYGLKGSFIFEAEIADTIGLKGQLDLSLGGGHSVTRARKKESTQTFGLDVTCAPSGNLQRYDDGKPVFDEAGSPEKQPGKVDAYRFMTFYLDADKNNFEDFYRKVVDDQWLKTSNDPNAAALRQARQSDKKPACWRIMHRVTYVSRVLPPIPSPTEPPLDTVMRAENIESNYQLIKRLEPYVRDATTNLDRLADATRDALDRHLPELRPHEPEITEYLALYYGVRDE